MNGLDLGSNLIHLIRFEVSCGSKGNLLDIKPFSSPGTAKRTSASGGALTAFWLYSVLSKLKCPLFVASEMSGLG